MEMKKAACAVLFAAAAGMGVAMAEVGVAGVAAPAQAPGPAAASGAASTLPVLGSVVVGSVASLVAYYLH